MSNWKTKTLGELLSLQRGYDLTAEERKIGKIPVIGAAGQNGFHNVAKASGPGIVVGRSGGSFGQVHFVKEDFWPHNTAMYVTDFKSNNVYFSYYLLKSLDFDRFNSGSAQPSLNRNFIYPIRVKVPLPAKQKKIADVLLSIDAKIEINNCINAELEAMAKILYDYWFVQFDFPNKKGKAYKVSGGEMEYNSELKREIPRGWVAKSALEVARLWGGGTPKKAKSEYWNGDIPFFTPTDSDGNVYSLKTEDYITEQGLKFSSTKLFPKNTVFITARGSIGRLALNAVPMAMNQSCYALSAKDDVSYAYLYFLTRELIHHLEVKASGSVFDSIVSNDIELTKLAIPGDREIISSFAKIVEPLFEKIELNTRENERLTNLRDWLLPMLMNGQVTVK
jgi:type I restriction enzyme, S subunit